eukprot:COSAG01_NODE_24354_length_782_cov_0.705710_1_plen_71_part_01
MLSQTGCDTLDSLQYLSLPWKLWQPLALVLRRRGPGNTHWRPNYERGACVATPVWPHPCARATAVAASPLE